LFLKASKDRAYVRPRWRSHRQYTTTHNTQHTTQHTSTPYTQGLCTSTRQHQQPTEMAVAVAFQVKLQMHAPCAMHMLHPLMHNHGTTTSSLSSSPTSHSHSGCQNHNHNRNPQQPGQPPPDHHNHRVPSASATTTTTRAQGVAGRPLLAPDSWLLALALARWPLRWALAAGRCWLLAAGCWLLAAGCWPLPAALG
jgi:hypothetical protein